MSYYAPLILALFVALAGGLKDCYQANNLYTAVCHSVPICNQTTNRFYSRLRHVTFDLADRSEIRSKAFANCSIHQPMTFEFRNVANIRSNAFTNLFVASNTVLNIRLTPLNHTRLHTLHIAAGAFHKLYLEQKSTLNLEILSYSNLLMADTIVASVQQNEHTTVKVYIHNLEEVLFAEDPETSDKKSRNERLDYDPSFSHNRSFSLEVANVDRVHFSSMRFKFLQVTPYSSFSIAFRSVIQLSVLARSFEKLQLGDFARFQVLIESVKRVMLGVSQFFGSELSTGAELELQLDLIGEQISTDYEYYSDEQENADQYIDEDDYSNMNEPEWFCVPSNLFGDVKLAESGVVKFVLSRFETAVSVSSMSFSNIQLSDNAKFQVMFTAMKQHIVFEPQSFHLIRLNDGILEVFVKEHSRDLQFTKQLQPDLNSQVISSEPASVFSPTDRSSDFDSLSNAFLELGALTFDKIFLTPRSYFRFGFMKSDSRFQLSPKAFAGFHSDQMDHDLNNGRDQRTKISLDFSAVAGSDEGLQVEYLSIGEVFGGAYDLGHFPKVVEIETYEPLLSLVKVLNGSDTGSVYGTLKRKEEVSQEAVVSEFCRFYKLRPLMAPFKYQRRTAVSSNNLVYFSEPIKLSSHMDKHPREPLLCTSCLFIYLYRTIHRREDFYYVKDHVPACFLNLHFGDNLYFTSFKASRRQQATHQIETSFKKYWSKLNCPMITGLPNIFQYSINNAPGDETSKEVGQTATHCRLRTGQELFDHITGRKNWREFINGVCRVDSDQKGKLKLAFKRLETKLMTNERHGGNFKWSVLMGIVCGVGIVFGLMAYRRRRGVMKFKELGESIQSRVVGLRRRRYNAKSGGFKVIQPGDADAEISTDYNYDELCDQYEYDDDFDTTLRVQVTSFHSSSKEKSPTKRINLVQSLKETIVNSVSNPHFISPPKEFPQCSYAATSATESSRLDQACGSKTTSYATYDIHKQKVSSACDDKGQETLEDGYGYDQPMLRVEANPLAQLTECQNND